MVWRAGESPSRAQRVQRAQRAENYTIRPRGSSLSLMDTVAHTLERAIARHFCRNEILIKKKISLPKSSSYHYYILAPNYIPLHSAIVEIIQCQNILSNN